MPSTAGTATPVPFTVNGCPDPAGCVEFTGGNYTACVANNNNIAPGGNGCLISPKFTSAGPPGEAVHAYTAGTLIQPTNAQHNAGGYIFQAQNSGNFRSCGCGPNPWNQTIGGNQVRRHCHLEEHGPRFHQPGHGHF